MKRGVPMRYASFHFYIFYSNGFESCKLYYGRFSYLKWFLNPNLLPRTPFENEVRTERN